MFHDMKFSEPWQTGAGHWCGLWSSRDDREVGIRLGDVEYVMSPERARELAAMLVEYADSVDVKRDRMFFEE